MSDGREIIKVSGLARIELTVSEQDRFVMEFERITAYFTELQRLELKGEMLLGYPCPRSDDIPRDYDLEIRDLTNHLKEGLFYIPPWLA